MVDVLVDLFVEVASVLRKPIHFLILLIIALCFFGLYLWLSGSDTSWHDAERYLESQDVADIKKSADGGLTCPDENVTFYATGSLEGEQLNLIVCMKRDDPESGFYHVISQE